jgi:hypothetical protein
MQRTQLAKLILIVCLLLVAVVLGVFYALRMKSTSVSASPYQTGAGIPAPDFDIRAPLQNALLEPPAQSGFAREGTLRFQRATGIADLTVRWSALTNAPSRVYSLTQALTRPSDDDPRRIAESFVNDNLSIFGLSAEDWREHRYTRDYVTDHNGAHHFTLQQQVNGIDVFGGAIHLNLNRQGSVVSLHGEPMPGIRESLNAREPAITSEAAIEWAKKSAGIARLKDSRVVGLIYFPMALGNTRLAWEVIVEDGDSPSIYRTIVDAVEGNGLWRQNQTKFDQFPAHGSVYSSNSPNPNSPIGTSIGIVARVDRPFNGKEFFPENDPHADWWNGSGQPNRNTTISNNVSAQEDRDGNNTGGFRPTAGMGEDFTFPIDLTMDPSTYQSAAITNLFYWNNRIHDIYYRLGFNEVSGNFQVSNFTFGGAGGDAVQADAQDNRGAAMNPSLCNANFNTGHADGSGARMQMFQCNRSVPERDGDVDQEVIIHEYTHGLSGRLVPALGGCQTQSGGMGEGWSDFMALSILAEPGDDLNGSYGEGGWLFNNNGIRRQSYSTNPDAPTTKVFSRTYRDLRDNSGCAKSVCSNNSSMVCTNDNQCGAGNTCVSRGCNFDNQCEPPTTTISQGPCQMECHNTGEIWANTLWIARANLIRKYGYATGNQTILQLVVDGMKLSPANPTFLDARDAILMADLVDNSGVNQCLLWDAFAKMGMGKSATTTGDSDRNPVEAFDTPSTCTPNIKLNAPLDLGEVCVGDTRANQLQVSNTGTGDLIVYSVARVSGSANISVDLNPTTPVFIAGGSHLDFTVRCAPSSSGSKTATIRIKSNDADQQVLDLAYTCTAQSPVIVVNDPIVFDKVCPGDTQNRTLTIGNSGGCDLIVTAVNSSSPEFKVVGVTPFPLVVPPGSVRDVTIQFMPMTFGSKMATLTILSNDPVTPSKTVTVKGQAPPPVIHATPDPLDFGKVCLGTMKDLPLTIKNTGECNLTVSGVSFSSPEFSLAAPVAFPLVIPPGGMRDVLVRLKPTSTGAKMATMTINSDDLATPNKVVTLKGIAPVSAIAITGPMDFGSVTVGKFKDQFLNISNTEPCDLLITFICEIREGGIDQPSTDFNVISPVAVTTLIPGGGSLPVQIRFKPQKVGPRNATLVVMGYDPATSSLVLTAHYPLKGVGK